MLLPRIELGIHPYHGCVMPLNYKSIGPPDRTRTCISRLSIVTRYKLAALPLSYRRIYYLAEAVRFELTEHFCPSVFKTDALSRALPRFHVSVRYFCVRNLTNPVSAAHPLFASAEPELSLTEIEVWCNNKLGGLPYSPNLEYIMLRLSPV